MDDTRRLFWLGWTHLRAYLAIGSVLVWITIGYTHHLVAAHPPALEIRFLALGIGGAALLWICMGIVRVVIHNVTLATELAHHPLDRSRASVAGCFIFVPIMLVMGAPALFFSYPFALVTIALVGVEGAIVGTCVYLAGYWDERWPNPGRAPDAIKSEQQILYTIFSGGVSWTGLFISGALLALTLGNGLKLFYDALPEHTPPSAMVLVMVLHVMLAAHVIGGTVLWMLRPLHHRIHQLARALDQHELRKELDTRK